MPPPGGSMPSVSKAISCSRDIAYQPMLEVTVWSSAMGMRTTSSIGYGQDQYNFPALNSMFGPSPSGLPKRRMTAFSPGLTVKNPDAKIRTTSSAIAILTMVKLLRSASDSACEPESCISGAAGG